LNSQRTLTISLAKITLCEQKRASFSVFPLASKRKIKLSMLALILQA